LLWAGEESLFLQNLYIFSVFVSLGLQKLSKFFESSQKQSSLLFSVHYKITSQFSVGGRGLGYGYFAMQNSATPTQRQALAMLVLYAASVFLVLSDNITSFCGRERTRILQIQYPNWVFYSCLAVVVRLQGS